MHLWQHLPVRRIKEQIFHSATLTCHFCVAAFQGQPLFASPRTSRVTLAVSTMVCLLLSASISPLPSLSAILCLCVMLLFYFQVLPLVHLHFWHGCFAAAASQSAFVHPYEMARGTREVFTAFEKEKKNRKKKYGNILRKKKTETKDGGC